MKKTSFLLVILLASCSPFEKAAKQNSFGSEEGYKVCTNVQIPIKSLTFGDIRFASSTSEFKKLSAGQKPEFNNIILYAKSIETPIYDYYILTDSEEIPKNDKYIVVSDISDQKLTLAASKNIPQSDLKFILDNLTSVKK